MADVTSPINWTIKNIAEEAKNLALARAKAAGVPVGLWLEKLLLDGAPMAELSSQVDLRPLAEVMRASADIMQASGAPIPKGAVRNAYTLLGLELRQANRTRKEQIQQPRQRQIGTDHAASTSSTVSGSSVASGSSGITPAIAKSDV